jgi:WD40 repeat protein
MDIYSLGVVMYELLTGERPFRGNARMMLHQVLHEEPTAPRRLNTTIPSDLETICLTCLEKKPERRYATAADLAADLARWRRNEPISVRPLGRLGRSWRWAQRNPALATTTSLAACSLLVAAIVAAVFGWTQWRTANDLARQKRLTDIALGDAVTAQGELQRQRNAANNQTLLAKSAEAAAQAAEQRTQQQLAKIRRLLYATDMSLAYQSLSESGSEGYSQARALLARYADGSLQDNSDLRSFEWRHLMNRCYGYRSSFYEDAVIVNHVACSHDGRLAAFVLSGAGSFDDASNQWAPEPDEIRLVDLKTHREIRRLLPGPGRVLDVFFGSDTLFELREYVEDDAQAGSALQDASREVRPTNEPWNRIQSAIGNWGRMPLTESPVLIRAWNLTDGQQVRERILPDSGASRAVSPDGNHLAVFRLGAIQQDVRVYDLLSDAPPRTAWSQSLLTVGSRMPLSIQFPATDVLTLLTIDSRFVESVRALGSAIGGDAPHLRNRGCDLVTIDLKSSRPRAVIALQGNLTDHVLFPPRRDQLVTIDLNGQVHVRDRDTGQIRHSYLPLTSRVRSADLSPDGKYLAVGVANRCLVYDLSVVDQPREFQGHVGNVDEVVFAADDNSLISAGPQGARVWDVRYPIAERTVQLQGYGGNLAFTRDGRSLYATFATSGGLFAEQMGISQIDLESTPNVRDIHWSGLNSLGHIWLSADDKNIILHSDDGVTVVDRDSMQPRYTIAEAPWRSVPIAVSSAASILAIAIGQKQICLYDLETGTRQQSLATHEHAVTSLAFLPGGEALLCGDERGDVGIWDLATGRCERGASFGAACTQLQPNRDGNVILVTTGVQWHRWNRGQASVESLGDRRHYRRPLELSPDGRTLAASTAESVWLMDPEHGQNRFVLKRAGYVPAGLAFSPDGNSLAVAWNPAGNKHFLLPVHCLVCLYSTRDAPPESAVHVGPRAMHSTVE